MRPYSVCFGSPTPVSVAISTQVDFFEFSPVAGKPIELVACTIAQTTEITGTVAEDEFLTVNVIRLPTTATSGSAGSAGVINAIDPNDAAAGFTAETCNTGLATTSGTAVTIHVDTFNIRLGFGMIWPSGYGPRAVSGQLLVVRLQTGSANDAISWTGTAYVSEV
jgi:hypothetical protein